MSIAEWYHGVDATKYPAIVNHLLQYRSQLENRATQQEWYELQQPQMRSSQGFDKPKIVYPEIAKESRFAYSTNEIYLNNKAFMIALDDKYLLGVLNSAVASIPSPICHSSPQRLERRVTVIAMARRN